MCAIIELYALHFYIDGADQVFSRTFFHYIFKWKHFHLQLYMRIEETHEHVAAL